MARQDIACFHKGFAEIMSVNKSAKVCAETQRDESVLRPRRYHRRQLPPYELMAHAVVRHLEELLGSQRSGSDAHAKISSSGNLQPGTTSPPSRTSLMP